MALTRRKFIEGIGIFSALYFFTPGTLLKASTLPLRPPGALIEHDFNLKCIRCFKCGQVCPTGAIKFGTWLEGQLADTPVLTDLENSPCNLCMECTKVCPTGALTTITPDRNSILQQVKIGIAHICTNECVVYNRQRPRCHICYRVCPLRDEAIYLDEQGLPVIDASFCVGCGLCVQACPVYPKAVSIRRADVVYPEHT